MTHQDFKKYSVRQQIYTIHQYAHFLTLTTIGDCITRLYALDDFYVEYRYNITTLQVSVDAFKDTDRLSSFLSEVDLSVFS
ncbi:hypothetical protein [Tunicatimonas pelagia]|uniref:hypothetical protein n=1 Tax=Tunicatimonas pelagia TaxID=931531 RepID=UPI0026671F08|nr:hypothetical protein [Tunicatimonas pelagia]WKN44680.1 hypothetical protein P0M28_06845 [Tunicatimonas pelagia]